MATDLPIDPIYVGAPKNKATARDVAPTIMKWFDIEHYNTSGPHRFGKSLLEE
jgi:hypothetical protein